MKRVLFAALLAGCSVDLQRRPDQFPPLELGAGPCTVTIASEHATVTIHLGDVSALVVREATVRALKGLAGQGLQVTPMMIALVEGLTIAGVDEGLCRVLDKARSHLNGRLDLLVERR